jgi:hypothetical protein
MQRHIVDCKYARREYDKILAERPSAEKYCSLESTKLDFCSTKWKKTSRVCLV